MDKNMSQTKNKFTSLGESEHQKSDKNLSETYVDEDSGLCVSSYSHHYPSDSNLAKSKGPETQTSKQKQKEEQDKDYLDSGIDSGIHSEQLLDSKEIVEDFGQMRLTDSKRPYIKDPLFNHDITREIFAQDEDGDTQVHIAISSASPALTKKIINCAPNPAFLDIENVYGQSPIHLAVLMGQPLIVRHLLICGAKATVRDYEGNTPLHLACRNNDVQSVAAILNPISSTELKSYGFSKQSHQSPKYQRIQIDLEQRNYFGEYCIHIAVQNNNADILKHLLQAGADINAREGRGGYSPLHLAVENQNEEMVKFLLKNGAGKLNVETLTYGQITAYQLANEYDSAKIMKHLSEFGCEQLLYPESDYEDSTDGSDMDSDD